MSTLEESAQDTWWLTHEETNHSETKLEPHQVRWEQHIFPLCSVNLITSVSNSGKTFFVQNLILNHKIFFDPPPKRLVYVFGSRQVSTSRPPFVEEANELPIVTLAFEEFIHLESLLRPHDIVIIDDVLCITEEIDYLAKVGAHHFPARVFIITQSCLGDKLYKLLARTHNIVLNFNSNTTNKLVQHLLHSFFISKDTKTYLRNIFSKAEERKTTCVLKLNSISSDPYHSWCLAFDNIQQLFAKQIKLQKTSSTTFCIFYPEISFVDDLKNMSSGLDDRAFYLVPAHLYQKPITNEDTQCIDAKKQWNLITEQMNTEIELYFPFKVWQKAKNLAREVLRNKHLCISADVRTISVKHKSAKRIGFIDFLQAALKRLGPNENVDKYKQFTPIVHALLKNRMPQSFIVNKAMLQQY